MWCDDHGVNDYDICGDDDTVIVMVCVIMFFVLMNVCVWYDDDGTETLFFSTKSPTLPATLDTVPAAGA